MPFLLLGAELLFIGLLAMNHIVNNWWPFDVSWLDLVRATALDRADQAMLLQAANVEIVLAFLAIVLVAVTGLALPLVYVLNRRLLRSGTMPGTNAPGFLTTLRQAMWVGLWAAFCIWLQMNRVLGVAVAGLVAAVSLLWSGYLECTMRKSA